jgi:peptide deformylase
MTSRKSDEQWIAGGAHNSLVTIGNPLLRQRAAIVEDFHEIGPLCTQMVDLLRELNGAGLAAPQIGVSARIIVVEVRKTDLFPNRPESSLYVMVNPRIKHAEEESEDGWEGCFSVPGLMGLVPRSKKILLEYSTADGVMKEEPFEGYLARVIHHECDHLDGTIFLDRMPSMKSITTVANYVQFQHSEM